MRTVKLSNEQRRILEVLAHRGSMSRAQLAEATGWSRNTVGSRLSELESLHWLDTAETASSGGRPAVHYSIARDRTLVFSGAFGASHATWGLSDLAGTLLVSEEEPLPISVGAHVAVDSAQSAMSRLVARARRSVDAVGVVVVGLPSPISTTSRRPINPSNMPGWVGVDVRGLFHERFGVPVAIENDAKLMAAGALATDWRATNDLVFIKVATGIGAGIVSAGTLQSGRNGMAGEIGHIPVSSGTRECDCGNIGCVARYSAIAGVLQSLQEAGLDAVTLDDLVALLGDGNALVARVLRQAGRYLGEVVAGLLAATNPEALLLGGTLASVSDELITGMREVLYAKASPALTTDLVTAVIAQHDEIALRGSVVVALSELLDSATHRT